MPLPLFAVAWFVCMAGVATAQPADGNSIPSKIGNRANGLNYQPTPSELYPREALAGVWPSKVRQAPTDRTLEKLDRTLLNNERLSMGSVPVFTPRQ